MVPTRRIGSERGRLRTRRSLKGVLFQNPLEQHSAQVRRDVLTVTQLADELQVRAPEGVLRVAALADLEVPLHGGLVGRRQFTVQEVPQPVEYAFAPHHGEVPFAWLAWM